MRAISTVVDTTLFLLLLGGAVGTLVAGTGGLDTPPSGDDHADETATALATTTVGVDYELTPRNNHSDGISYGHSGDFDRTAHGTVAGLLAAATRTAATLDGERIAPAGGGFERAVRNETHAAVHRRATAVGVTAVWEPYDGAPLSGRVHAGPTPPASADVRAARLTVDSGVAPVDERAREAARTDGTDGVAHVVAAAVVEGFFSPAESRVALRGDAPADTLAAHRYRRVARLTDAPALDLENGSVAATNDRLTAALADRFAADMRDRFETPAATARAVSTGEVRIVVRTWSP